MRAHARGVKPLHLGGTGGHPAGTGERVCGALQEEGSDQGEPEVCRGAHRRTERLVRRPRGVGEEDILRGQEFQLWGHKPGKGGGGGGGVA